MCASKRVSLPPSSEIGLALVQHFEKHQIAPGLTMFIGLVGKIAENSRYDQQLEGCPVDVPVHNVAIIQLVIKPLSFFRLIGRWNPMVSLF